MNDRQIIQLAKTTLTPREYDAWRLHTAGMSLREIALATGITKAAVQDRLRSARRKLHQALEAA